MALKEAKTGNCVCVCVCVEAVTVDQMGFFQRV